MNRWSGNYSNSVIEIEDEDKKSTLYISEYIRDKGSVLIELDLDDDCWWTHKMYVTREDLKDMAEKIILYLEGVKSE
jgi:hypothetical protein